MTHDISTGILTLTVRVSEVAICAFQKTYDMCCRGAMTMCSDFLECLQFMCYFRDVEMLDGSHRVLGTYNLVYYSDKALLFIYWNHPKS